MASTKVCTFSTSRSRSKETFPTGAWTFPPRSTLNSILPAFASRTARSTSRVTVPLFGLHMGAYGALVPLIVQDNFGLRHFGRISGLVSMATVLPYAVGPLMAGASVDISGSYGPAFFGAAVLFATGIGALTQVRPPAAERWAA